MVVIRMARGGARNRPFYNIVVADSRCPRDGRYIEKIGTYDPLLPKGSERVKLVEERVKHWLGVGAQPTESEEVRSTALGGDWEFRGVRPPRRS